MLLRSSTTTILLFSWAAHLFMFLTLSVTEREFPRPRLGRGGPIAWPPRSPDLTPLDFFLWGYVKDQVNRQRVNMLDELKAWITAEMANVIKAML
jgi:hypothetical protein